MNASVSRVWVAAAVAITVTWPTVATAQATRYPIKPIRIIDAFAPGGTTDMVARLLGQELTKAWGQPVIVDNRPGGSGTIGIEMVTRAAPDGYTLLVGNNSSATNVSLFRSLSYDPLKDLAPVVWVAQTPFVLAVNLSVPAKSVQDFIDLAKAKPGQLLHASGGPGGITHLTAELFKSLARINMLDVPYKGTGPALAALLGGEVQATFSPLAVVLPQARAGKVRALAVGSAKRVEIAPDLPTIAESGVPNFESTVWQGIFAPGGTPPGIVNQLNAEINRILQQPEVRERFLSNALVPVGGTSAALGDHLKVEIARWAKVVKEAGIKLD
jgi:tripartite-type tricarboxylate transporter receptor subunit TctC